LNNPQLSALEKFQRYFDTVARWKTRRKIPHRLLRVWYTMIMPVSGRSHGNGPQAHHAAV